MTSILSIAMIALTCALIILCFPIFILAFYRLRLGARRRALAAKLIELDLEEEYLKVFHFAEWEGVSALTADRDTRTREIFLDLFAKHFRGDNSVTNYLVPFFLTVGTTSLLALYVLMLWGENPTAAGIWSHPELFAIAGAMAFVYPIFVSRYASLSLNPPTILELNGKIWFSVLIGIVATTVFKETDQPLIAFLGGLLPITVVEVLKKRILGDKIALGSIDEANASEEMLAIVRYDRNLLAQLNYIGVRSVLELAYENPIRLFVESDPILVVCIDMVDQANLHLYVPDLSIRLELNRYGIRTAIDLMTQLYDEFPTRDNPLVSKLRFLDLDEALPAHLVPLMTSLAGAMKLADADALRNLIAMMVANPQLQYVFYLWASLSERVDRAFSDALQEGNLAVPLLKISEESTDKLATANLSHKGGLARSSHQVSENPSIVFPQDEKL